MTIASAAAIQSSLVSTAVTSRSDRSAGNSSFAQILDGASTTEDSSVESASQYPSSSAQSTFFDSSTFRSSSTSIRYSSSQSAADESTSAEEEALQANRQSTGARSTSSAFTSRSQTGSSTDSETSTSQRTPRSSAQSSKSTTQSSPDSSSSETENTNESSAPATAVNTKDGQQGHGGRKSSSGRGKATAENQVKSGNASGSTAIFTALVSQDLPDSQALPLNLQLDAGQADVAQGDTAAGSNSNSSGFAAAVAGFEAGSVTTATQQDDAVPTASSRRSSPTANAEGTAAVQDKTEMAFAARVQAVSNASGNATGRHASDTQQSTTSSAALRKAAGDAAASADPKDVKAVDAAAPNTATSANNAAALFSQNSRLSEVESVAKADAAAPVAATAQAQPETQAKAATPLKDISLHLSQDGAEKVEVRVVQEAGEIRVAVRTGDSDLATGLRQGIHELTGKLEDNGYRADTWRPSGQTTSATSPVQAESSGSTSAHSQSGDAESGQQGSQQDSGQRDQNQSNRPRWVEELETSISSGGESTGETNGIVS